MTFAAEDRWPALAASAQPCFSNKKAQPALVAVTTKPLRGRAALALGRRAGRGDGYGEMG